MFGAFREMGNRTARAKGAEPMSTTTRRSTLKLMAASTAAVTMPGILSNNWEQS